MPLKYWQDMREAYNCLAQLTSLLDSLLGPLILANFTVETLNIITFIFWAIRWLFMSLDSVIESVVAKLCNIQWSNGFVYALSPSYASHAICDTYHPSMSVLILLYYSGEVQQFAEFRWEALILP